MNENDLKSPQHNALRRVLRIGGPFLMVVGLVLIVIGIASFFSAMNTFELPRYFWCAFAGMPLLFLGTAMTMIGFLSAVSRYLAGETAPVAKDTANYMAEGMQPGVKAVSRAVTEGIVEGLKKKE